MKRALNLALLFLPTTLNIEQHQRFGAALWFDEMWHWLQNYEQYNVINEKIFNLFLRFEYI